MEQTNKPAAFDVLRTLKLIYLAILFSSGTFILISFILISVNGPLTSMDKAGSQGLLTVGMLAGVLLVALAYYGHTRRLIQIKTKAFEEKINSFRNAMIIKIALQDSALMFLLVIYLLTAINSMLLGSFIIFILLLINRPTIELFTTELELSDSEISEFQERKAKDFLADLNRNNFQSKFIQFISRFQLLASLFGFVLSLNYLHANGHFNAHH